MTARTIRRGFTLIELIVVVAIIAGLAAVVLVSINPAARLRSAQNAKNASDAEQLSKAVRLYLTDNPAATALPKSIDMQVCKPGQMAADCVNLDFLVGDYLSSIPETHEAARLPDSPYSGFYLKNDFGLVAVSVVALSAGSSSSQSSASSFGTSSSTSSASSNMSSASSASSAISSQAASSSSASSVSSVAFSAASSSAASSIAYCGDDFCDSAETTASCVADCAESFDNPNIQHIQVGSLRRSYSVYVPLCYKLNPTYNAPMVMALHGGGQFEDSAWALSYYMGTDAQAISPSPGIGGLNRKAEQACFIAVYPNGIVEDVASPLKPQYWNAGTNRAILRNPTVDDVAFLSSLIDKLKLQYRIDAKRVFVTGISNGAMMAYRAACELSTKIAAVAPNASGLVTATCAPLRPVPVFHMHGTNDVGWPYNGGPSCIVPEPNEPPIIDTINAWRTINGCDATSAVTYQNGGASCVTYDNCTQIAPSERADVTFCTLTGGGHTWPGGTTTATEDNYPWLPQCPFGYGPDNKGMNGISPDIATVDAIWNFFATHPMP